MPIDPVGARGVRSIGTGVPDVLNMLQQRRQQEFQNQLATRDQALQEQNALAYQNQVGLQQKQFESNQELAKKKASLDWGRSAVEQARANPALIPKVIAMGKQLGHLDPSFPDYVAPSDLPALKEQLDQMALQFEAGAPPAPFEQSDEYKKIQLKAQFDAANQQRGSVAAMALAREKARLDSILEKQKALGDIEVEKLRVSGKSAGGAKLPPAGLKIVDDATQSINTGYESISLIEAAKKKIINKEVNLGLVSNTISRGLNLAGQSSESSRAFSVIQQTFEKLRNNYLLLAKGVQTEGDAERSWNSEVGENAQNDNNLALQQLERARSVVEGMAEKQRQRIKLVNSIYGSSAPQPPPPPPPSQKQKPGNVIKHRSGGTIEFVDE